VHGAHPRMVLPGCYKATVNESETITAAEPFGPVRGRGGLKALGLRFSVTSPIERS
jgi:hypothetical protein